MLTPAEPCPNTHLTRLTPLEPCPNAYSLSKFPLRWWDINLHPTKPFSSGRGPAVDFVKALAYPFSLLSLGA